MKQMSAFHMVNLTVRFLLEIVALVLFGMWGWQAGQGAAAWLLAVGAPLTGASVWGMLIAPRARFSVNPILKEVLALTVFALAALAWGAIGHPMAGWLFALVAVGNSLYLRSWKRDSPLRV